MTSLPYDQLPEPPADQPGGAAVLARLIDGAAFRYRWASEGLADDDLAWEACEGAHSIGSLLDHLRFLARWVAVNLAAARDGVEPVPYPQACDGLPDPTGSLEALRAQTLSAWSEARSTALALGDDGLAKVTLVGGREPTSFPVWNLLNGPLADALTHIGQLNAWRRQLGKPAPRADVFRGRPPRQG